MTRCATFNRRHELFSVLRAVSSLSILMFRGQGSLRHGQKHKVICSFQHIQKHGVFSQTRCALKSCVSFFFEHMIWHPFEFCSKERFCVRSHACWLIRDLSEAEDGCRKIRAFSQRIMSDNFRRGFSGDAEVRLRAMLGACEHNTSEFSKSLSERLGTVLSA